MDSINNRHPDLVRDFNTLWHPCTQMKDHEADPPLLIEHGDGVYLYDVDGRKFLDVISSWWVNLFGHNHRRLNAAVSSQLEKMAHVLFAGVTHKPAIDLAETLIRHTPDHLKRVFFSDNGSTSVEVALKMSVQYWRLLDQPERNRFAYLEGGYHGETLGALSVCGIDLFRSQFTEVLNKQVPVDGPDCYRCPYGKVPETCGAECFESMEKTLRAHRGRLAGIIVEPLVQGAAGMKMYPLLYLQKLQDACEAEDIHLIFDEVAVGFGRTGSLFVCEGHDLRPTFLCLSKGITSGYLPLAATLTTEKIYKAFYSTFDSLKLFIHSHSYSANPLACACANETLSMLTEDGFLEGLRDSINKMGDCGDRLRSLPWCGEFRKTGMIARMELVRDRKTKEAFPFEKRVGYQIYLEGLKREVLMRPLGNVIYFIPPLIIGENDIKKMMDTAYDCVQAVLG